MKNDISEDILGNETLCIKQQGKNRRDWVLFEPVLLDQFKKKNIYI